MTFNICLTRSTDYALGQIMQLEIKRNKFMINFT